MPRTIDDATVAWATEQLKRELQSFADDPYSWDPSQAGIRQAWAELKAVGSDLGVSTVAQLKEVANAWELTRLSQITGENFS